MLFVSFSCVDGWKVMRRREERPWDHTTGDGNSKDDLIDRRMVINKAFECGKREEVIEV